MQALRSLMLKGRMDINLLCNSDCYHILLQGTTELFVDSRFCKIEIKMHTLNINGYNSS
jgi:hypothetical protein